MKAATARKLQTEAVRQVIIKRRIAQARARAQLAGVARVSVLPLSEGVRRLLADIRNDPEGLGDDPGPKAH